MAHNEQEERQGLAAVPCACGRVESALLASPPLIRHRMSTAYVTWLTASVSARRMSPAVPTRQSRLKGTSRQQTADSRQHQQKNHNHKQQQRSALSQEQKKNKAIQHKQHKQQHNSTKQSKEQEQPKATDEGGHTTLPRVLHHLENDRNALSLAAQQLAVCVVVLNLARRVGAVANLALRQQQHKCVCTRVRVCVCVFGGRGGGGKGERSESRG